MNGIKIVLLGGFSVLFVYFFKNIDTNRAHAGRKVLALLFFVFAVVSIMSPELFDSLAHDLGIGRGTDLLLYGLTLAFLFAFSSLYLQLRKQNQAIITLARKIALLEAAQPVQKRNKNR